MEGILGEEVGGCQLYSVLTAKGSLCLHRGKSEASMDTRVCRVQEISQN